MAGNIVVWFLVGGVVLLVGRRFQKILTGEGCGCGGGGCARTQSCDQTFTSKPGEYVPNLSAQGFNIERDNEESSGQDG